MKDTVINKKSFFISLFILMNITGWALFHSQQNSIQQPYFNYTPIDSTYRFIKYKYNTIFTPDSTALFHFFSKLDSLQNKKIKKINILQIGDSHIQADLLSDKMRRNFQKDTIFGNGGYGLAYPYAITKSNNPTWYTSTFSGNWETCRMNVSTKSCDWGIAGINSTTKDVNASFNINLCAFKSRCYEFNKVVFFCNTNDSTQFKPTISTLDLSNDILVESVKIDSVNQIIEYYLSKPISTARFGFIKTQNSQFEFTLKGISLENTELDGIIYHSIGLNSATANTFLRSDYAQEVKKIKPDLIIISLGTNDAYSKYFTEANFYNTFSSLIKKLQEAYPQASILLTSPGDSYRKRKYPNLNFTKTPAIFKQLAKENHCAFWNLHQVMGGYKSINKWYIKQLCQKDKLHFTRTGYELQADLLFDALMKKYSLK